MFGLVNFSDLCTRVSDSPFSHVALVSREDDELIVYDVVRDGTRRMPFAEFAGDKRIRTLAVKRLHADLRHHVPAAISYCQHVYQSRVPFDQAFKLNNDCLYCSEMIEIAFRRAGLMLSTPMPIEQLPGYQSLPVATRGLVEIATPLYPSQDVLMPGNQRWGIWSSPSLELVLDVTPADSPPPP